MTLPRRAEAPPSGIPSWARVGAKVVCVDTDDLHWNDTLAVGCVYTLAWVGSGWSPVNSKYGKTGPSCELAEIKRPIPFAIERFRPVVDDSEELGIETVLYRQKGRKSKAPVRENERA